MSQGATAMGLSARQFQRLKVRFRVEGAQGLVHKARGQPSAHRLPPDVQVRIGELLQTTYAGFTLWLLRAFFQSIPIELEEAARVDGAGRPRAVLYVVAPLALPGLIATAIFTFTLR